MVARNDLLRTEVALRSVVDQQADLANACATSAEALNKELGLDPMASQVLPDGLPRSASHRVGRSRLPV